MIDNPKYKEQIEEAINSSKIPWEVLDNTTVMITGAAGMIGSAMTDILLYLNEYKHYHINIIAVGRTKEKLCSRFSQFLHKDYFSIKAVDLSFPFIFRENVDYIIHAASNADPFTMANYPVDTLLTNVIGLNNVLSLAKKVCARKVIYISSGEIYGQPEDSLPNGFRENYCGKVDYSSARSCYPAGKRAGEVLCQSYISQYGLNISIARPCHCYGPTMTLTDSRAVSQFIRNVLDGKDIILKSDGSLVRSHCYVLDAAMGIFYIIIKGKTGSSYNIADSNSTASIFEIASMIANEKNKKVIFELPNEMEKRGFSAVTKAVLNSEKLQQLGWNAKTNLSRGIHDTLDILESLKQ